MKICKKCQLEGSFSPSELKKNNGTCRTCISDYYFLNKEKYQRANKVRYLKDKERRLKLAKYYYQTNKDHILSVRAMYVLNNKEKVKASSAKHYIKNKSKKLKQITAYQQLNKNKINKVKQLYKKNKRITDPSFKMREVISASINFHLKNNNVSKNGKSCLTNMPWSLENLVNHLESLFEPWMNWSNHGTYIIKEWDDRDNKTWKWQLDHITPHSSFQYISLDSDEFMQN